MSEVITYTRHKFDHGVVQISAERMRGQNYLRLALKRLNADSNGLVDVVSLLFEKQHPQAATAIVEKIQLADFERAYQRLLEEYKLINQ